MRASLSRRFIARAYLYGAVWGAVMLGTVALSMAATSGLFGSVSMDVTTVATITAVVTMALAVLVASGVTAGLAVALRRRNAAQQEV